MRLRDVILAGFASLALAAGAARAQAQNGRATYLQHCASCHGEARLGGTGPALLPDALRGLRLGIEQLVADGRPATQMPGFAGTLDKARIAALADYLREPFASPPSWSAEDIRASRQMNPGWVPDAPAAHAADPLNLFVVVEAGDHHVTVLDGDRFEPLTRFPTRFALHGGPKFSPDGRFVFFMSRDGWITKYDLKTLSIVGEIRAGLNSRNIAMSSDGRHLAVANYVPTSLVILSTDDLGLERTFDVRDRWGKTSRVSAVYQAPTRKSFVAALKDVSEIWEISTDPDAPPVVPGFTHSSEKGMVEALSVEGGLFRLRRIDVTSPLDDFFFDPSYRNLIGSARDGSALVVVNLNVAQEIRTLSLPGLPHLGSGIAFRSDGRSLLATPHLKLGAISVIDMDDWSLVKTITTSGPGFFIRSHENTRFAWTDGMLGDKKDTLSIVDKRTMEAVRTVTPSPGRTAAHVEFDRTGEHALVSIWENPGELVIYDARTFEVVKRLPMAKPSGKYNVWNKISFSEGTSH